MPLEVLGSIEVKLSFPADLSEPIRLELARIKENGIIWEIHKNDADPYPSNPHAHNVDSGEKLDLSNGDIYRGRRNTGNKLRPKVLISVRDKCMAKGIQVPLLAIAV